MDFKLLYEDIHLLVIDKPAGIAVFPEGNHTEKTVIDYLIEQYPHLKNAGEAPRYGIVHRLDKDTSGVLLIATTPEALIFFQKQFKNREVEKKYLALATGTIKEDSGQIHTLIARSPQDPRKQKAYEANESAPESAREAITEYKVLQRFKDYTLLEVNMETGRKHQIRCHLAHIHHPIAGDKLYSFKDSPVPEALPRQFLHAEYLTITLTNGKRETFHAPLPKELQNIIDNLR